MHETERAMTCRISGLSRCSNRYGKREEVEGKEGNGTSRMVCETNLWEKAGF